MTRPWVTPWCSSGVSGATSTVWSWAPSLSQQVRTTVQLATKGRVVISAHGLKSLGCPKPWLVLMILKEWMQEHLGRPAQQAVAWTPCSRDSTTAGQWDTGTQKELPKEKLLSGVKKCANRKRGNSNLSNAVEVFLACDGTFSPQFSLTSFVVHLYTATACGPTLHHSTHMHVSPILYPCEPWAPAGRVFGSFWNGTCLFITWLWL